MKKPNKKLQAEWDRKLAESGFVDAEARCGDEMILKRYDSNYFTHKSHGWRGFDVHAAHAQYFADARHQMWRFKFNNKYDKTIWWLHANGLYNREIARIVGKSKDKIRLDLKRIRREMLCLN